MQTSFYCQLLAWKGFPRRVPANLTYTAGMTHLLRNILSNYCCGVHRSCTDNPLKSDRRELDDMAGKPIKMISFFVLAKNNCSIWRNWHKSDCENRTVYWDLLTQKFWGRSWCNWKTDMPVLGLAGRHKQWKIEAGTQSWSGSVSHTIR